MERDIRIGPTRACHEPVSRDALGHEEKRCPINRTIAREEQRRSLELRERLHVDDKTESTGTLRSGHVLHVACVALPPCLATHLVSVLKRCSHAPQIGAEFLA